jgi:hypothetical protein
MSSNLRGFLEKSFYFFTFLFNYAARPGPGRDEGGVGAPPLAATLQLLYYPNPRQVLALVPLSSFAQ